MIYSDNDFILGMQQGFVDCAEWYEGETIIEYDEFTSYQNGNGFSSEATQQIDDIVKEFYEANKALLIESELTPEQCGHDLFLTANGHGAGFWDRGIDEIGDKLTEACQKYNFHIYANDSGLLEIE